MIYTCANSPQWILFIMCYKHVLVKMKINKKMENAKFLYGILFSCYVYRWNEQYISCRCRLYFQQVTVLGTFKHRLESLISIVSDSNFLQSLSFLPPLLHILISSFFLGQVIKLRTLHSCTCQEGAVPLGYIPSPLISSCVVVCTIFINQFKTYDILDRHYQFLCLDFMEEK